jgi:hypothetical protein
MGGGGLVPGRGCGGRSLGRRDRPQVVRKAEIPLLQAILSYISSKFRIGLNLFQADCPLKAGNILS